MQGIHSRRFLPHIAVIDDSLFDIKLIQLAFKKAVRDTHTDHLKSDKLDVSIFTSGQALLSVYFGDEDPKAPKPDICFLDLSMPGIPGLEVLKKMKSENATKHIPIYILSTSNLGKDIEASYRAGANGYLVKPNKKKDMEDMAKSFVTLWSASHRFLR